MDDPKCIPQITNISKMVSAGSPIINAVVKQAERYQKLREAAEFTKEIAQAVDQTLANFEKVVFAEQSKNAGESAHLALALRLICEWERLGHDIAAPEWLKNAAYYSVLSTVGINAGYYDGAPRTGRHANHLTEADKLYEYFRTFLYYQKLKEFRGDGTLNVRGESPGLLSKFLGLGDPKSVLNHLKKIRSLGHLPNETVPDYYFLAFAINEKKLVTDIASIAQSI